MNVRFPAPDTQPPMLKTFRWFDVRSFFVALCVLLARNLFSQETNSIRAPKFLGSQTCGSSSCHGGAGDKSNQYTLWSTHDFHHARPYATLETARSERLAEVLKIGNPTTSPRCTVCHAPFQTVPSERLGHDAKITEGVSCETCHGPAENWIRSHTRPDYKHADRVAAGMSDLNNLYVRANTCVACHQNIDPEIRAAGHPELIFEMDGQSVAMPRHWPRSPEEGPKAWLVGQSAALREIGWQLLNQKAESALQERCAGLFWVLRTVSQDRGDALALDKDYPATKDELSRVKDWADLLAHVGEQAAPSEALTQRGLSLLANTSNSFTNKNISVLIQARRAERLVLALERLTLGLHTARTNSMVNASLNKLFADAQSLPDFDPNQFAKDLNEFHSSVAGFLEPK
jgi:hypothetical protein